MSFVSLTDADRDRMLATIGVESVEALFADLPENLRLRRDLDVGPALSELELMQHMGELASRNVHTGVELSFRARASTTTTCLPWWTPSLSAARS